MTILEVVPPSDDTPSHAATRFAFELRIGWHVQVAGRWPEIVYVSAADTIVSLEFADGSFASLPRRSRVWVRTPADQVAYVSGLWPTTAASYRPDQPLGTLYGGSARSPLGPGD